MFRNPFTTDAFDLDRSCGTGKKTQYTEEELERYEKRGAKITDKGWLQYEDR